MRMISYYHPIARRRNCHDIYSPLFLQLLSRLIHAHYHPVYYKHLPFFQSLAYILVYQSTRRGILHQHYPANIPDMHIEYVLV